MPGKKSKPPRRGGAVSFFVRPAGFEPAASGSATLRSIQAELRAHITPYPQEDLNLRPSPPEGDALPLSYGDKYSDSSDFTTLIFWIPCPPRYPYVPLRVESLTEPGAIVQDSAHKSGF